MDLHRVLQQRVQRAAESAALPAGAWPPRLPTWWFHHHAHLHHQGQPVLTKTDKMEEDKRWHIWRDTHGCTLDLLQGRDIALRRHYRLYLQHCRRADLYQMFPTTKDIRTVNKALSLITPVLHTAAKTGVIEVVNTVLWGCQKDTARKMQSGLEIKDIFTSACSWTGLQNPWESPVRQSKVTRMWRVDQCINKALGTPNLQSSRQSYGYKEKQAVGWGKWKQSQTEGEICWWTENRHGGWHGCYGHGGRGPGKTVEEMQ